MGPCVMLNVLKRVSRLPRLKELRRYYARITTIIDGNSSKNIVPTFRLASLWPYNIAITDQYGHYSYRSLFLSSKELAGHITELLDGKTQKRVAFLCPNDASYVLTQWACWISGQIAVPLSSAHPVEMLEYFINDSESSLIITTKEFEKKMKSLSEKTGKQLFLVEDNVRNEAMVLSSCNVDGVRCTGTQSLRGGLNPNLYSKYNALILYTSGTTATPKGVVLNYSNLCAQVNGMISAWGWSAKDSILHTLPLHHIHGIVNALITPLHCGARCVMLPKFNAREVWNHLLSNEFPRITVLTGVPTMYAKLIEEYDSGLGNNNKMINYVQAICSQKIRLMMCGSASLPESVFDRWYQITGHRLLERYGMTEIGMALSNSLNGLRKPGFVGIPLPGVSVRIVDNKEILVEGNEFTSKVLSKNSKHDQNSGELQIKGPNVFKEYWKKPNVTRKEFTEDGWFKTGDIAEYVENSYKILGRLSVDIIKSGGYKISALFIESTLLQHPNITDVAVIGLPDSTWGQKVIALLCVEKEDESTVLSIKKWTSSKIPLYMLPSVWKVLKEIPRNTMGKINKMELINKMKEEIHSN